MLSIWNVAILVISVCFGTICFSRISSTPTFHPDIINGKIVCICGASSGIGEELAFQYAKLGAQLILAARRKHKLDDVKKKCRQLGSPKVHTVIADFANPKDTVLLFQETVKHFGKLDVLILNHVVPYFGLWRELNLTHDTVHAAVEVNALSYIKLATLFTPMINESGGSIGIISSMTGIYAMAQAALYSSCKHALHGFFDTYRIELAVQNFNNVSITMCIIGPVATNLLLDTLPPNATDMYGCPISSITETGTSIIHAVTSRERQMYFPYFIKYYHYFSVLFPEILDGVMLEGAKKHKAYGTSKRE